MFSHTPHVFTLHFTPPRLITIGFSHVGKWSDRSVEFYAGDPMLRVFPNCNASAKCLGSRVQVTADADSGGAGDMYT